MKKLLLILFFIFLSISFIYPKEIVLKNTPYGDIPLLIPDSYEELKMAYIEMSAMYLYERFEHENSLKRVEKLFTLVDQLQLQVDTLIDMPEKSIFKQGMLLGYNFEIEHLLHNVNVGYQFMLYGFLNIQIFITVPSFAGTIQVGILY